MEQDSVRITTREADIDRDLRENMAGYVHSSMAVGDKVPEDSVDSQSEAILGVVDNYRAVTNAVDI